MQMAVDKWLLEQHLAGKHPHTLRFYTWMPAVISLGFHQHKYPESWQSLSWQGKKLDLVKRPTGGRAVLHQGDLTYAVVTSGLSNSRMQAYQEICEFLIVGWKQLGIDLDYGTAGRGYIHNPNCFGTATSADLVTNEGYKLIGSAQLRKDNVILQHGSMRLQPDAELFSRVFGEDFVTTEDFANLNFETIIDVLISAARDCFNIEFEIKPLTEDEWKIIVGVNGC
ncbi:lipoate--protein ligase family protein [Brunnivagina elsteri]|uniref:Biotin--protein ligase n=1 Tax=Brunnivagina elsteri CCALA 953 TaxID=987040 RepID=A0A2A2TFB0_9CYAN|nr:biotin/lipoate A/B protein ligase family protein [Calothrix elsteri]PAX52422.1 biotin--protein ligase [Calothrix elsteri CCALA 953]